MRRGEVVLIDWQYSDRTGSKMRPAVVVQADFLNGLIDDTVLVQVTSTIHGVPGSEVELDPAVETSSGLLRICYAFCTNVADRVVPEDRVEHPLTGRVSRLALNRATQSAPDAVASGRGSWPAAPS